MFTHNLDPVLFDFGLFAVRWYSMAYIAGILIGWWLGKKILIFRFKNSNYQFNLNIFDDLITYLIISIIIGGRIGYIIFYNLDYYFSNPLEMIKIWEGGMSFHGALAGIIIGTYFFSKKREIKFLYILDIIACVAPIGIFFGRIANFINAELVGKVTNVPWGVIFPSFDLMPRHPSQLYESFLEGAILFLILNTIILKKNYKTGTCSYAFLIFYGMFRIISEFFREPDIQIGYFFNYLSLGALLSIITLIFGFLIIFSISKNE